MFLTSKQIKIYMTSDYISKKKYFKLYKVNWKYGDLRYMKSLVHNGKSKHESSINKLQL